MHCRHALQHYEILCTDKIHVQQMQVKGSGKKVDKSSMKDYFMYGRNKAPPPQHRNFLCVRSFRFPVLFCVEVQES